MAIKINLLAEARAAEELRRRDPVKRCALGGAFLVVLSLVWFSAKLTQCKVAEGNLARVQTEIDLHTNEYNSVMVNLNKNSDAQKKLEALQQLSNCRFLQGDLLNALQQTAIVPGVQLTHLRVDQTVAEKIDLSIDARDSSDNPSEQVGKFKEAMLQQPYFKTMLETNGIQLKSLSAPQTGPDGKPYVLFTLDCQYSDHLHQ